VVNGRVAAFSDALALADEIEDGNIRLLIERALDEARSWQFRADRVNAGSLKPRGLSPPGARRKRRQCDRLNANSLRRPGRSQNPLSRRTKKPPGS
jgi:hypothetical protein